MSFQKILHGTLKAFNWALFLFLAVFTVLTFTQVLSRFVFKVPIKWTIEVIRICFVWMVVLGIAVGTGEDSHLKINIMDSFLSPKRRLVAKLVSDLLVLITLVFILVSGIEFVTKNIGKTTVTLINVPINVLYVSMLISAPCALAIVLRRVIEDIKAFSTP